MVLHRRGRGDRGTAFTKILCELCVLRGKTSSFFTLQKSNRNPNCWRRGGAAPCGSPNEVDCRLPWYCTKFVALKTLNISQNTVARRRPPRLKFLLTRRSIT